MLLSRSVPLDALVHLCRMFKYGLAAGLSLVDVFRQQARKGPYAVRPLIARISGRLDQGDSLEEALKPEARSFPPLFTAMVAVGERSGNLPEIFRELEEYFELQRQLRRDFRLQMIWPTIEFVLAVFVIAFFIWIMSIVNPSGPDPMGLGLTGGRGAITFVLFVVGFGVLTFAAYRLFKRKLRFMATIESIILRLPIVGPCLQMVLLTRFCLAMKLTLGAGLGVKDALRGSLEATGSAFFAAKVRAVSPGVRRGRDIAEILATTGVIPEELQNIVETGEESGRLPEVMGQQALFYQDEATRKMKILTGAAAWLLYGAVAVMIIWAIFRIYSTSVGPYR